MYTLISRREVWLHAVQSTVSRYNLVYGDISALDLDCLRELALAPTRWDDLCQSNTHDPSSPSAWNSTEASTRKPLIPKSQIPFTLGGEAGPDQLHLIPGGRYLLTSNDRERTLKIYDLGLPSSPHTSPILIAHASLETGWTGFRFSVFEGRVRVGIGLEFSSL